MSQSDDLCLLDTLLSPGKILEYCQNFKRVDKIFTRKSPCKSGPG